MLFGFATANAVDTFSGRMSVSPASGSTAYLLGNIQVSWDGVVFEDLKDGYLGQVVNLDKSKLQVKVNGQPLAMGMGDTFRIVKAAPTDEGAGQVLDPVYFIQIYIEAASTPVEFLHKNGVYEVTIPEGVVTSTTGQVNPAVSLTYNVFSINEALTWSPAPPEPGMTMPLTQGSAVVKATWDGANAPKLVNTSGLFYQEVVDGEAQERVYCGNLASIDGNALKLDFSALPIGTYNFTLPEGAIEVNTGVINGENYYNFTIGEPRWKALYGPTSENLNGAIMEYCIDFFRVTFGDNATLSLNSSIAGKIKVMINGKNKYFSAYIADYNPPSDEDDPDYGSKIVKDNILCVQLEIDPFDYLKPESLQGTWTVTIPAGAVNVTIDGITSPSEEITFSYLVDPEAAKDLIAPPPTVKPAEGSLFANTISYVDMIWEDCTVKNSYDDDHVKIGININHEPAPGDEVYAWYNLIDAEGYEVFDDETPAEGIRIYWSGYTPVDENWGKYTVDFYTPWDMLKITGKDGKTRPNPDFSASWEVVQVVDDITCDPAKGSQLKGLEKFNLKWDLYEAELNSDCTETPYCGMLPIQVTANDDNTFTVDLGTFVNTQGWLSVFFPAGYFMLTTDYGKVPSPSFEVSYNIEVYTVMPTNFAVLEEPFETFTIYADNIKLIGDVEKIEMRDVTTYELLANGASYKEVNDPTYGSGIEFTLSSAYDKWGYFMVTVPLATLSIDNVPYYSDIMLNYSVHVMSAPTVTPESGSEVKELVSIQINWEDSALYQSFVWEEEGSTPFTISYNGGTPEDITGNVLIENVYDENVDWDEVLSSTLAISFAESPFTKLGKYVVTIPANYVEIAKYEYTTNEALTLEYTVADTGVSEVVAPEAGVWTVYTLSGVKVLETADGSLLDSLAPGLYIINGQKVIKK